MSCRFSYDVFLSFRGEDTRKTFTDHLYTALVNAGIRTFRDDDEIDRGHDIKPELNKAIHRSRSSIIVFSKHYASSRWCLDELVMIFQRHMNDDRGHVVLPVFYDVDPSHVRKQTGSFAVAFARHRKTESLDKVKEWREALAQVADLAGMVLQNQADGYKSKFIQKIVKVIGGKLNRTTLSVSPNLIGIHSRVRNISLWLQDGSTDVGVLVIYGMSGIEKTTIAKFVYNSNFRRFDRSSFLENIKEISEQPNGLVQLQLQLLSNILDGRKVTIHSVSEGITKIADAIQSRRVLLVLDDVDHMDQLDAVLRWQDHFYPGSKIIIITTRLRLLKAQHATKVHNVETLNYKESLELFSWHAFGQDHPVEGYMKHSEMVVHHSGGLPLALQVLGSSLSGESISIWESALQKLEAIPNSEIVNKLKISYDSLQDDHDRRLFLHIACFFIGNDRYNIVRLLDDCDFYTTVGIQNLVDRGLVTIDGYDKVQMHNMIRDMGRGIVRQESEDPEKRSRVWHYKDSFKVLTEKNGAETIEGLVLNRHMPPANTPSVNSDEIMLETNVFARMYKLRLLHLSNVQLNGCYKDFPTKLRWLCWHAFRLDSVPADLPLENLVVLEMHNSSLTKIWKGTRRLPSLKILDLSYSHGLTEIADFSPYPNLEKLVLIDCANLIRVHESIGSLERLVYLNVKDCKRIMMLPESVCLLKSLETLIMSGCLNLIMFPMEMMKNMESLKVLEISQIPIDQLLTTGGDINSLSGRSLGTLWTSLPRSLVELCLSGCNLFDEDLSGDISNLSSLKRLDLGYNPICGLPNSVKGMKTLDRLSFTGCQGLKSLLGLPKVDELYVYGCYSLEKITYQSSLCKANNVFGQMCSLLENEYMYKLEPIGSVDVEMINVLGLCNLDPMAFVLLMQPQARDHYLWPIQGLHEGGIFSTFLSGNEVPGLFSHKSTESSISFVVPLVPTEIRGLNIFVVYENLVSETSYGVNYLDYYVLIPIVTKVRNRTKGLEWIYCPSFYGIPPEGEEMIWLSHWKMENQLEGGDEVTVTVFIAPWRQVKQCGVHVVHEKEENMSLRKICRDPFYPYVIGGDLSGSEVMPGSYFLSSLPEQLIYKPQVDEFIGDSDTEIEEQEDEPKLEPTGGSSCDFRGWKGLIVAAGFFLSLSLFARFPLPRRKKHSA